MAHPLLQFVSPQKIGILLLTVTGCFTTISLIAHSYVVSLEGGQQDVFDFVDRHNKQIEQRQRPHAASQEQNARAGKIKKLYEQEFPPADTERIRNYVQELRRPYEYQTQADLPYDIYNCPHDAPPPDYPYSWNVMNVIQNWNPATTTEPARLHQSLCVFDYDTDFTVAQMYREAEVPFLMRNTPPLLEAAERWNRSPDYLSQLFESHLEKAEHSHNNHFMYFKTPHNLRQAPEGWTPPMELTQMTFQEWYKKAQTVTTDEQQQERYYFRAKGVKEGLNDFLYQELPIFEPIHNNFFMVSPEEQRGINCRFGMKGVIAETHYDQSRNFIVLLGGQRRYILAHPRECQNLQLYPQGHPSGRHSAVDWTNPDLHKFPEFSNAQVHEVVLQAGDALYLPTFWFHFIVSLNVNYQCNARSGMTNKHMEHIHECGFG
jgi:hypothetical protein